MPHKPRINILYTVLVIAVFYFAYKNYGENLEQLILIFTMIDLFIAFFAIVKGILKREFTSIIAGAICGIIAFSASKNISYSTLLFQVLGGIVGTGAFITKRIEEVFK